MDNARVQDALDALDSIMADKTQRASVRLEAIKFLFNLNAPLPYPEPEPVSLTTEQFNALVDLMWSVAVVVRENSKTYSTTNECCRQCRRRAHDLLVGEGE